MDSTIIDTLPPPATPLRQLVEALEPGQSLCTTAHTLKVLRTTVSRIRAMHPSRTFRTAKADDGPRVWRIK